MIAHIIINPDNHRPKDDLYCELDKHGIDAKFWPCVPDRNNVVRSINLSHKQIVRFAAEHHFHEICIMEEDVMFPVPDGWEYFISNKPTKFDLYLGGAYGLNDTAFNRIANHPGCVEVHNFAGLHCYIINESYYSRFLSIPDEQHIDNQPGLGRFFVCAPFAALQRPGYSYNAKRNVDYNSDKRILPPECIYHGKKDSS
jgi:hypothetical protein